MSTITFVSKETAVGKSGKPYFRVKDTEGRSGTTFADVPTNVPLGECTVEIKGEYTNFNFPKGWKPPVVSPTQSAPQFTPIASAPGMNNRQIALLAANIGAAHVDNKLMTSDSVLSIAKKYLEFLEQVETKE